MWHALLISGYVDCSLRLPDAFMLRFRDPGRIVVEKSGVKIGSKLKVSRDHPRVADAGETHLGRGDFTGGRGRHAPGRSPSSAATTRRTGCSAVGTPSPTRRQRHPTPPRRSPSAPSLSAGDVKSSSTVYDHLGQCGQTDWEFIEKVAKRIGYEVAVRDNKLDFGPRKPAKGAPSVRATRATRILLCCGWVRTYCGFGR